RVEDLLGVGLVLLEDGEAGELARVAAREAHDVARRVDAPEVGGRGVAERGHLAVRARVAERGRVAVEPHVAHAALAVCAERALQVADTHVVRLDREVLAAPELRARELEVADRARDRGARVEALVDPPAARLELAHGAAAPLALRADDLLVDPPAL